MQKKPKKTNKKRKQNKKRPKKTKNPKNKKKLKGKKNKQKTHKTHTHTHTHKKLGAKGHLVWPKVTGYFQRSPVMDGNLNEQLNSMLRMLYWVFKL